MVFQWLQLIDGISPCCVTILIKLDPSWLVSEERWNVVAQDKIIEVFFTVKFSLQTIFGSTCCIALEVPIFCDCVVVKNYSIHHRFNLIRWLMVKREIRHKALKVTFVSILKLDKSLPHMGITSWRKGLIVFLLCPKSLTIFWRCSLVLVSVSLHKSSTIVIDPSRRSLMLP